MTLNGTVVPGLCSHPLDKVTTDITTGKSTCGQCGAVGRVYTRGPGGLLIPKERMP